MFDLLMLPASDGDCLILSYGEGNDVRHVVIDGGRIATYKKLKPRLENFVKQKQPVELLVLSHIDADHIEGFLPLAAEKTLPFTDIWYNGYAQLSRVRPMGPNQGDRFSEAISTTRLELNRHFKQQRTAVLSDDGSPLTLTLDGGLKITLLSPDWDRLTKLRDEWEDWRTEKAAKEKEKRLRGASGVVAMGPRPFPQTLNVADLASAKEVADTEAANGSSIAFVAEWNGRRVLLAADAHPALLEASIAQLAEKDQGQYRVDLFKVSHHGSAKNTSRTLLTYLNCNRFAISSDGSRHGHPDPETIAKLIASSNAQKTIYFNYRQSRTTPWANRELESTHNYTCEFPSDDDGALRIPI